VRRQPLFLLSEEEIEQRLEETTQTGLPADSSFDITFPPGWHSEPPRPAAVLVPFLKIEAEWHILFTRRTDTLPEHSGQVAFPGGRADPGDLTPVATALREAYEEIGISPQNVRILGTLDPFLTITNYLVTPVIGRIIDWPCPLTLAEIEVKRVFTIPLAWLINPTHREVRQRVLPFPHSTLPVIYFHPYDGETLWGVSAQITWMLFKALRLPVT
jgi:8-oxo-dGTP pyrophosphatase MutT (NUDIX family)